MVGCKRFVGLLVLAAILALAGCDQAQSLIEGAKKKADELAAAPATSTTASNDPASTATELVNTPPMLVAPPAVDDAARIAQWKAKLSTEHTDDTIQELLQASPESLAEITEINFQSAGPALTAVGLRLLKNLPLVTSVNCMSHAMDADQVAALCELPQLEVLNLRACKLNDSMLSPLKKLATLRTLDLSNNGVTDAGLAAVHNLVELQSIDIASTQIAGASLLKAKYLGGLRRLNADGSRFSDGFATLKSAVNLEYLGVSDSNIGDQHLKFLSGLSNLREVYLHGNLGITDVGFAFLNGNPNFEVIDIRATSVAGPSLKFLKTAHKLKLLRTQVSKVDALTLTALRKALPDCTIE